MIEIDQAIFTSARTRTSQGYRVTASTAGVTADETRVIATSSPSHQSLADDSAEAQGLAFYELPSGRFCIARTIHAGCEQTARGGHRVLTQTFVLSPDQFALFGCNAFSVLRAIDRASAYIEDPSVAGVIAPARVEAIDDGNAETISRACDAAGESLVRLLIDRSCRAAGVLMPDLHEGCTVVEAAALAVPHFIRRQRSFAIGLKFTLARRRQVNVTGPITNQATRSLRGQKIELVAENNIPQFEGSPWLKMFDDCRAWGRVRAVLKLNRLDFGPTPLEALDSCAAAQIEINHIGQLSVAELLTRVVPVETEDAPNDISENPKCKAETILDEKFIESAKAQLRSRLASVGKADTREYWLAIIRLVESDDTFQPVAIALFERIADLDPPPPGWSAENESATKNDKPAPCDSTESAAYSV